MCPSLRPRVRLHNAFVVQAPTPARVRPLRVLRCTMRCRGGDQRVRRRQPPISLVCAVHCADILVGNIGSPERMKSAATPPRSHLAAPLPLSRHVPTLWLADGRGRRHSSLCMSLPRQSRPRWHIRAGTFQAERE